jgi:putative two-component system response regulator
VAVADVFDALISVRPYKEAWPVEEAVVEIVGLSGSHFDPEVIEAFEATISDEPVEIATLPAA